MMFLNCECPAIARSRALARPKDLNGFDVVGLIGRRNQEIKMAPKP
jgi:hypothetical protein